MNAEKLSKLEEQVRIGGKGTPRRKMKRATKPNAASHGAGQAAPIDSTKVQGVMKKLNAQNIPNIDEVNMFKEDGRVIHFNRPTVNASAPSNTFTITGPSQERELTELAPGILSQLGPGALASLQKMAELYQKQAAEAGISLEEVAKMAKENGGEIPDLIENFESSNISAN